MAGPCVGYGVPIGVLVAAPGAGVCDQAKEDYRTTDGRVGVADCGHRILCVFPLNRYEWKLYSYRLLQLPHCRVTYCVNGNSVVIHRLSRRFVHECRLAVVFSENVKRWYLTYEYAGTNGCRDSQTIHTSS